MIEELQARLEVVTRERDEARAEAERLREESATQADISSSTIARMKQQLREARAEAEGLADASTHWQVMLKREMEEVERLERKLQIERMGIRPIDEVRCAAYRRGAEAMREACVTAWDELKSAEWETTGERLLAIPIPEEP